MIRTLLFLLFVLNPALAMEQKQQDALNLKLAKAVTNNSYQKAQEATAAGANARAICLLDGWESASINHMRIDHMREESSMLHIAAQYGSVGLCDLLMIHGASPFALNACKKTPLHYAALECRYKTCTLLISHGANPNATDDHEMTPLAWLLHWFSFQVPFRQFRSAAENNHLESKLIKTCRILLEHGADVNTIDNFSGESILSIAAQISDDLCALILSYNPSTEIRYIVHPLMNAARKNQSRRCRLIVDYFTHFKPTIFTTLLCLNRMRKTCMISGELYRHFKTLLLPHLDHQLPPLSILAEHKTCYEYVESLKGPHKESAPKGVSSSWCCIQ